MQQQHHVHDQPRLHEAMPVVQQSQAYVPGAHLDARSIRCDGDGTEVLHLGTQLSGRALRRQAPVVGAREPFAELGHLRAMTFGPCR